ncbi:unnamed protein product [Urochloa humidicola]
MATSRLSGSGDESEDSSDQEAPDTTKESQSYDEELVVEEASYSGTDGVDEEGSPEPASASSFVRAGVSASAVAGVTVADADALKCGVCLLPLRPPTIFQCEVGHVVCSSCRDKLEAAAGKCHVCGVVVSCGYRRCHAMERLVDSIRIPCPYAAHGCAATPAYHGREEHRRGCPHAPCHCPGETCGFTGSTTALLDHFAGAHNWPCTAKVRAGETFSVRLHDGFNFVLASADDRAAASNDDHMDTNSPRRLFLLNVTQERLGRAISVLCIVHPNAGVVQPAPEPARCELVFSRYGDDGSLCRSHYQKSDFQVACTDLSDGLPSPDRCFQFVMPNSGLGDDDDDDDMEDAIQVKARILI